MNTDDNEKRLAQLAMMKPKAPQADKVYGVYNQPTVKPVKGFDASTHKAERSKAKRARKLAQRHQMVKG